MSASEQGDPRERLVRAIELEKNNAIDLSVDLDDKRREVETATRDQVS